MVVKVFSYAYLPFFWVKCTFTSFGHFIIYNWNIGFFTLEDESLYIFFMVNEYCIYSKCWRFVRDEGSEMSSQSPVYLLSHLGILQSKRFKFWSPIDPFSFYGLKHHVTSQKTLFPVLGPRDFHLCFFLHVFIGFTFYHWVHDPSWVNYVWSMRFRWRLTFCLQMTDCFNMICQ